MKPDRETQLLGYFNTGCRKCGQSGGFYLERFERTHQYISLQDGQIYYDFPDLVENIGDEFIHCGECDTLLGVIVMADEEEL